MPSIKSVQQPTPIKKKIVTDDDLLWGEVRAKCVIYGQAFSGKTTLASTFPDPILWLLCSGGSRPGELKSINTPENRKRITPKRIESYEDLKEFIKLIDDYATVVIDHLTGYADKVLASVLKVDKAPAIKKWGLISREHYGQQTEIIKEGMRDLFDKNDRTNIVLICQERTNQPSSVDEEIIRTSVGPDVGPAIANWICPSSDWVIQTTKRPVYKDVTTESNGETVTIKVREKGVTYSARIGQSDIFTTKFRVPRGYILPEFVDDPSYRSLIEVERQAKEWKPN